MSTSHIVSLRRMRSRLTRAPWGARLLATALALALVFALTPCCDVLAASAGTGTQTVGSGAAPDDHDGGHAPDNGEPCAAWLDRSDALAGKGDGVVFFDGKVALDVPYLSMSPAVPAHTLDARPAHLPIPPPTLLYLRHAHLIL